MRWGLRRLEFGDKSDWPRLLTDVASRELLDDGLRDSFPGLWILFRNLVVVEQDPPHCGREWWECPYPPQQPGGLQLVNGVIEWHPDEPRYTSCSARGKEPVKRPVGAEHNRGTGASTQSGVAGLTADIRTELERLIDLHGEPGLMNCVVRPVHRHPHDVRDDCLAWSGGTANGQGHDPGHRDNGPIREATRCPPPSMWPTIGTGFTLPKDRCRAISRSLCYLQGC